MPPCPPHLAHTASRVSSSTCLPSFHLIFLSSDLFAAACLFSCFFPYSGSFSCFPAFHRTSSIAYTPAKYARISLPCLVKEQGIRTISFRLFARFSWNSPRICPAVSGFLLSTTVSQYFASVYRYAYGNASSGNVFFCLSEHFPDGQPPICKYHILPLCASAVHQERNSCHNACKNRQQECPLANPHNKAQGQKQRQRRRENAEHPKKHPESTVIEVDFSFHLSFSFAPPH